MPLPPTRGEIEEAVWRERGREYEREAEREARIADYRQWSSQSMERTISGGGGSRAGAGLGPQGAAILCLALIVLIGWAQTQSIWVGIGWAVAAAASLALLVAFFSTKVGQIVLHAVTVSAAGYGIYIVFGEEGLNIAIGAVAVIFGAALAFVVLKKFFSTRVGRAVMWAGMAALAIGAVGYLSG